MKNPRKAIKKAQSVFMQAVVFPVIEECRAQFAQLEKVPYMPEMQDCCEDAPEYMEMYNWGDR